MEKTKTFWVVQHRGSGAFLTGRLVGNEPEFSARSERAKRYPSLQAAAAYSEEFGVVAFVRIIRRPK